MPAFICQKCGYINPPEMRFCGKCGAHLPVDTALLEDSQPPASSALPGRVGAMEGADLLERFRKAGLESAGQRRNVTILFVDLSGFTAFSRQSGSEASYTLIQQFTNLMARDVYKYDGMVDKFLGDGLMAIFGAPIAHENNAELAIRSALDMRADVYRLIKEAKLPPGAKLDLHIGLHSGPVVVGSLGSNMLMNYTAIGDTVNLAYRLLEAAPAGYMLASQAVVQQTNALFDFEARPPISLKGLDEPVRIFEVRQLKALPGPARGVDGLHAPLVGRAQELKLLRNAQDALIARQEGRFVWIQGEPGVGKTRLVSEFTLSLEQAGLRWFAGHSLIYRRAISYWIFQDLLSVFLELPSGASESEVRTRLTAAVTVLLGKQAEVNLPYLEFLLSLPPANEAVATRLRLLDAAQLRQQVFLSVRELLVAAARRVPLVFILEDLHWADEASLDLLRFLIDSIRSEPLLVVGLARPSDDPTLRHVVERADRTLLERFLLVPLAPLSSNQSERLLDELLTSPQLPAAWRAELLNRASGNPFFLEELVRMLIDSNLIRVESGCWRPASDVELSTLGVPDSVQDLILARFDRLPPYQRRLLQAACVIGRDFSSIILSQVLPPDPEQPFAQALAQLVERGFLVRLDGQPGSDFRFNHTLVSDAIYAAMLMTDRSELHGQVGEVIERMSIRHPEETIELLARHFAFSDRPERALHYLILAGEKAARGFVNAQARENFEFALQSFKQVEPTLEQVLRIYTGLGDVLMRMGNYADSRKAYQTALAALDSSKSQDHRAGATTRASLHRKIGSTCERQGDYALSLSELSAARAALEEMPEPTPVEHAWIFNDIGWVHFRRGDLDGASTALLEALRLVEDSPHYDLIASIYNRLGGVCYQKDQIDQASGYVRKSLFLRQEIGDSNGVARSYNNLGLLRWKRGDWDSALDDFNRSIQLHANLGDVEGTIELHSNLGLLHLDRGNFDEARQHLETGLTAARQIGHSYHIGLIYLHFCRLYVTLENWERALKFCRMGFQTFNEIGVMENLVDLNTYAGLAYLGLGDLVQAEKCAQDALELFLRLNGSAHSGLAEDRGRALRLLGQVNMARGQHDRAMKYLKESESIFKHVGNQIEQGRTALVEAQYAINTGSATSARLLLNDARLIFRQLGARVDLKRLESLALQVA